MTAKKAFCLSVLVAPVSRTAIVLGKVLGGTTLAAVQGMIFLIFAPFAGVHLNPCRCYWLRWWYSWFRFL